MHTGALQEMMDSGIREDNWQLVEQLCARLVNEQRIQGTWQGRNKKAVILGGVGVALGIFATMTLCCWGVLQCWGYDDGGDEEDEAELERVLATASGKE